LLFSVKKNNILITFFFWTNRKISAYLSAIYDNFNLGVKASICCKIPGFYI